MQQELAERVMQARTMLQQGSDSTTGMELAGELRNILEPLAAGFDRLDFGAQRKLLRICAAFDRLEAQDLDRGERVRLDIDLLGLWIRVW